MLSKGDEPSVERRKDSIIQIAVQEDSWHSALREPQS
jgi:hypothetical protein